MRDPDGNEFCVIDRLDNRRVRRVSGRGPGSGGVVEPRDVVVVGGSAGSLDQLAAGLPAGLPGFVAVTTHVAEQAESRLSAILGRVGPLPAAHAQTGEPPEQGRIYVAPPGCCAPAAVHPARDRSTSRSGNAEPTGGTRRCGRLGG
jgi:chemotaxis response regulator CheB